MDLTLDDLVGKCDDCGGTGKKPQEPGHAGGGRPFGRRVVTSFALGSDPEDCGRCVGTGRRGLTATGRAVVDLLTVINSYNAKGRISMLLHAPEEGGGDT